MRTRGPISWLVVALAFAAIAFAAPMLAQEVSFASDVTQTLGGSPVAPYQAVRYFNGGYSTTLDGGAIGLDPRVQISAVMEQSPGVFLFACDTPFKVRAATYSTTQVMKFDGATLSVYYDLATAGVPSNIGIAALAPDPNTGGRFLFVPDAPFQSRASLYQTIHVIEVTNANTLSAFWTSLFAGIPMSAQLTGFWNMPDYSTLSTYDVPVTNGAATYPPGTILKWDGAALAPYFAPPGFSDNAIMTGFSLPASPGTVPDGTVSTVPLRIAKSASPGALDLLWGSPCSGAADGYAVYEGSLGSWYSHAALSCLTQTTLSATVTPNSGNKYYLLVPTNGSFEGFYGFASNATVIPPSATSRCRADQVGAACP